MNFLDYIKQSDQYMQSLYMCMDNAWAAEKMYDWDNLGNDNSAWEEGPYISAGANCPQIDRKNPYCLRVSSFSSNLVGYQLGTKPIVAENGGVKIGHDSERIKANVIIPTVAICMQFSLLESIDIDLFYHWAKETGIDLTVKPAKRYDRRPARSRMDTLNGLSSRKIPVKCINAYESVSNFRNKLTHEPEFFCGAPDCAIDVYIVCQAIAYHIFYLLYGEVTVSMIKHRKSIWLNRINHFKEVLDFK
jgi:hypothetical protein